MRVRRFLGLVLLPLLKWYLRWTPLGFGRTRVTSWAVRLLGDTPQLCRAADDRKFLLQFPRDRGWEEVWLTGTFETGTGIALRKVLRPDDVTFDIGANVGWYTTLFAQQCPNGRCHAFEPEPGIFAQLVANCALNGIAESVTLNNLGVFEKVGTATIYRFANLPHGHSSISPAVAKDGHGNTCQLTTLNHYCEEHQVGRVDLVKVDVEGAELPVLRGAAHLFALRPPPMWLVEVNVETSRAFGYKPLDLLQFLAERGCSRFYRVIGGWGTVAPLHDLQECSHGDNVLCVPTERLDRVANLT